MATSVGIGRSPLTIRSYGVRIRRPLIFIKVRAAPCP
jgi:hypothetical protein